MTGDARDFVERELAARGGAGSALLDQLGFLRALNDHLADFAVDVPRVAEPPPAIWLIGLPRSGTTLLMQLLVAALDLGYVTNVAARLWRAPLVGIRLSAALLGQRRDRSFASDHGKTADPAGPHEFGYFWQERLCMTAVPPFNRAAVARAVDWAALRDCMDSMNVLFGRPALYKGMHVGLFIDEFAAYFPRSVFVHLVRDPLEVAISLANARLRYYGSLETWWSLVVEDFATLSREPWWRQIGHQVAWLDGLHRAGLAALEPRRVISVDYAEVCAAPREVAAAIAARVTDWSGQPVGGGGEIPAYFAPSTPAASAEMRARLVDGLREAGFEVAEGAA